MSERGSEGGLASLGKGAKWLGGIIVVAMVGALTPVVIDSFRAPEELAANIEDVSIDKPVSLAEFARRKGVEIAALPAGGRTRFAAYTAQAPQDEPGGDAVPTPELEPEPEPEPEPGPGGETIPGDTTTAPGVEEPEPELPATTPGTSIDPNSKLRPGDRVEARQEAIVPIELDIQQVGKVNEALTEALQAPGVPRGLDVSTPCKQDASDEGCGLATNLGLADEEGNVKDFSTMSLAMQLTRVFKGTRNRRVLGQPAKRDLLGVYVTFNVKLIGFRGGKLNVRWSLWSAGGSRVRDPWLVNRQVQVLDGRANKDSVGGEFWAPLPRERGLYYIRIEIRDSDNRRLDYVNTRRFH